MSEKLSPEYEAALRNELAGYEKYGKSERAAQVRALLGEPDKSARAATPGRRERAVDKG